MSNSLPINPVKRRRLYEDIVEQLMDLIISGQVPAGTQLPSERELVDQFGVGRSAVREALFALQKMGLVTLNSGEPATVIAPTPDALVGELKGAVRYFLSKPSSMRDMQGARIFFETGLARYAAQHATAEQIKALKIALDLNERTVGDSERFIDTDVDFHRVLADIPGNSIFATLHVALLEWLREQRATSGAVSGSRDKAFRAHREIFNAVNARDADAAEQAMRAHLNQVADFYWQATKSGGSS
jgi:DNA-binding FadR family transcriptional regulator